MKQAIAGVAPAELSEVTVMTVWPSIASYPSGRFLGTLYAIHWPDVSFFRLGNLLALLSIPHALALYFYRILPGVGVRYRLTNRRVVVERGVKPALDRGIELDRFDAVDVVVQPGQAWFAAGDLIFRRAGVEVFRLDGVSRPESFRQVCLKAHRSHVGVKQARERQLAHAAR